MNHTLILNMLATAGEMDITRSAGSEVMNTLPLWLIYLLTVVLTFFFTYVGFLLGLRERKKMDPANRDIPITEIVAGMFGLLAFMLGFTFDLASTRFEERRHLVIQEAHAIGTAYLRAGMLQQPFGSETRTLFQDYVNIRINALRSGEIEQGILLSQELQTKLWRLAEEDVAKNPTSVAAALYIYSLNQVIDLGEERVTFGLHTHIPASIWGTLYFISFCSMAMLGFHGGLADARRNAMIIPLLLVFAMVMLLIAGLDRPRSGLVLISQEPLVHLQQMWSKEQANPVAPAESGTSPHQP